MKRELKICSILAAIILVVVPCISVVGYQSTQANKNVTSSPLFAMRLQDATQTGNKGYISAFLGKGRQLNIFPSKAFQHEDLIQTAMTLFSSNPSLVTKLIENLDAYPYITQLLTKYGLNILQIKNYMKIIQNDPTLLTEEINAIQLTIPNSDHQQPLGLSTSNPLGCFIVALVALIPITVILTLLLLFFTLRIFTCMNINDCASTIANQIWDQLIQGLTQG